MLTSSATKHVKSKRATSLARSEHRRQATALTHLAETNSDPDTAKALLRIAAEPLVTADEAERTLALTRVTNKSPPT